MQHTLLMKLTSERKKKQFVEKCKLLKLISWKVTLRRGEFVVKNLSEIEDQT